MEGVSSIYLLNRIILLTVSQTVSIEPTFLLAFVPDAFAPLTLLICVLTGAVLFAGEPLAVINAAIGPLVNTMAVFMIVLVVAGVASAVGPPHHTVSIHLVLTPQARVGATVLPSITALAVDFVGREVAFVGVAVGPSRPPSTLLNTIDVVAVEF